MLRTIAAWQSPLPGSGLIALIALCLLAPQALAQSPTSSLTFGQPYMTHDGTTSFEVTPILSSCTVTYAALADDAASFGSTYLEPDKSTPRRIERSSVTEVQCACNGKIFKEPSLRQCRLECLFQRDCTPVSPQNAFLSDNPCLSHITMCETASIPNHCSMHLTEMKVRWWEPTDPADLKRDPNHPDKPSQCEAMAIGLNGAILDHEEKHIIAYALFDKKWAKEHPDDIRVSSCVELRQKSPFSGPGMTVIPEMPDGNQLDNELITQNAKKLESKHVALCDEEEAAYKQDNINVDNAAQNPFDNRYTNPSHVTIMNCNLCPSSSSGGQHQ